MPGIPLTTIYPDDTPKPNCVRLGDVLECAGIAFVLSYVGNNTLLLIDPLTGRTGGLPFAVRDYQAVTLAEIKKGVGRYGPADFTWLGPADKVFKRIDT